MDIEHHEIVIIGAGPAGSTAALQAARAGLHPLLIEKDPTPGATNACGGFAAETYRRNLQLPDEVVEREIRVTKLFIDGQFFRYGGKRAHYISFRRAPFDTYLARRAVEAGAELLTSTYASILDSTRRRIGLRHPPSGHEWEIETDIVIFADGPATLAADTFGIGHRPDHRTRQAIFVELDGVFGDGATCEIVLNTTYTKSYFWLFPKLDCVWVGVGSSLSGGGPPLATRLSQFIEQRDDLRGRAIRQRGSGIVPSTMARDFVADGAMVVGDAAGLANPMTGGGIAFALVSGEIAGRVAAEAIRAGRVSRAMLLRYPRQFRRTPHYWWFVMMAWLRQRLDRQDPALQPRIYARMLQRYLAFFHHAHSLVDSSLGFSHRLAPSFISGIKGIPTHPKNGHKPCSDAVSGNRYKNIL
jgi:digeranylgeranylglycerophospholipid reductase